MAVKVVRLVRHSPWWKGEGWEREDRDLSRAGEIIPRKRVEVKEGSVTLLRGIRRAGKSFYIKTLIKALIENGTDPRRIAYIPCDRFTGGEVRGFIDELRLRHGGLYVFLDEITYLRGWRLLLKELGEEGVTTVATGSNPVELKRESELLPGRGIEGNEYYFNPLSFREFARFMRPELPDVSFTYREPNADELLPWYEEPEGLFCAYLQTGGFPEAVLEFRRGGKMKPERYEELIRLVLGEVAKSGKSEETARELLEAIFRLKGNRVDYAQRTSSVRMLSRHRFTSTAWRRAIGQYDFKLSLPTSTMLERLFSLGYSRTFAERYYQLWGERALSIAKAMERPLPRCFRVNTLRIEIPRLTKLLNRKGFQFRRVPWAREGFCLTREPFSITSTPEYLSGLLYIQEASSMYPPVALEPKPGEIVGDMAAAPGGKTGHMAQLMGNEGIIYAFDVGEERLKETRLNLSRLGVTNTVLFHKSSLHIDELGVEFDKILLDAPCTGSGTIHKNPERKASRTIDDVKFCQGLQMKLIEKALEILKKGGVLVYSTCSLEPEENEFVVQWVLDNFDAELLPLRYGESALTNPFGIELSEEIKKARRFYPDRHGTSGFFVAKIRRI